MAFEKRQDPDNDQPRDGRKRTPIRAAMLVLAVLLMAVGVAAPLVLGGGDDQPATDATNGSDAGDNGLAPAGLTGRSPSSGENGDDAGDTAQPENVNAWSPAVFRLGFSFFIGFAIAAALRAFLKLTFVFAGLFALLLFGLQYAGMIDVNWTLLEGRYDSTMPWLSSQFESAGAFILGYIPSAASFLAGFGLGFRK